MTDATVTEIATKKAPAVVNSVTMTDGRVVGFAGNRQMLKTIILNGNEVSVRFDFANGEVRYFKAPESMIAQLAGHGASQKIGDETTKTDGIDDTILAVESIIARLEAGEWGATRTAGDGFSGASIVIRAIAETSGKSIEIVKAFLQKKLDAAKAKGEVLTRQKLYESFRAANTPTGAIIARLEAEKAAKKPATGIQASELLGELEAA